MYKSEYDEIKVNLIKKSLEKNKTDVFVPVERRKGNDFIISCINLICFLCWEVVVIVIFIIVQAGKNGIYISDNLLWMTSRFWNVDLLNIALILTISCFLVCLICMILNFTRHRRRTDRIRKSLIFCQLICLVIGAVLILSLY